LLLQATDELHDRRVISDRTWQELEGTFSDRELIELCLLVGHYEMLAVTLNSLGVEPEERALAHLGSAAATVADRLRGRLLVSRRS
jgi:hypothetical protein